jgi:hypothetical protein
MCSTSGRTAGAPQRICSGTLNCRSPPIRAAPRAAPAAAAGCDAPHRRAQTKVRRSPGAPGSAARKDASETGGGHERPEMAACAWDSPCQAPCASATARGASTKLRSQCVAVFVPRGQVLSSNFLPLRAESSRACDVRLERRRAEIPFCSASPRVAAALGQAGSPPVRPSVREWIISWSLASGHGTCRRVGDFPAGRVQSSAAGRDRYPPHSPRRHSGRALRRTLFRCASQFRSHGDLPTGLGTGRCNHARPRHLALGAAEACSLGTPCALCFGGCRGGAASRSRRGPPPRTVSPGERPATGRPGGVP